MGVDVRRAAGAVLPGDVAAATRAREAATTGAGRVAEAVHTGVAYALERRTMVSTATGRRHKGRLPEGVQPGMDETLWQILLAATEDVDGILAEFRALWGLWQEMIEHPGPLNVKRLAAFHRRLQRVAERGLSREDRLRIEEIAGLRLLTERSRRTTARRQGRAAQTA